MATMVPYTINDGVGIDYFRNNTTLTQVTHNLMS